MLYNFLELWGPIQAVITISTSKAFKNKDIILSPNEIVYLRQCLDILSIFVKATTKLQAEKWPTLYYIIPLVYQIYTKLDNLQEKYQVSIHLFIILKYILIFIRIMILFAKLLIRE